MVLMSAVSTVHAASDWVSGLGYKARLVEGSANADGTVQAGFEIVLEDGWKTYWRVPGESGIPPLLEFKSSSNIKDVTVHWPAPATFKDSTGFSIGYKHHVLLPFTVTPEVGAQSVELNLSAFFGVCSEICVPADARISLSLDPGNKEGRDQRIIDDAMIKVPTLAHSPDFNVSQAKLESGSDAEHVYVQLQLPDSADDIIVLTEGPQNWYFDPYLDKVARTNAKREPFMAKIPVYREARDALSGEEKLRITVIANGSAIEKTVTVQ